MENKKQEIIKEVRELHRKYGVKNVTMDDVSRHLGVSKKTLYIHFKNKTNLIEEIITDDFKNHELMFQKIAKQGLNPIKELLNFTKYIQIIFSEMSEKIRFDLNKYYPKILKKYSQCKKKNITKYIQNNIERGIRQNLYYEDINAELSAIIYIILVENLFKRTNFHFEKFSFEEIFEVIFTNYIRGIANKKGLEFLETISYEDHFEYKIS